MNENNVRALAKVIAARFPNMGGEFCYHCGANKKRDLSCVKGKSHENEAEILARHILEKMRLDRRKIRKIMTGLAVKMPSVRPTQYRYLKKNGTKAIASKAMEIVKWDGLKKKDRHR